MGIDHDHDHDHDHEFLQTGHSEVKFEHPGGLDAYGTTAGERRKSWQDVGRVLRDALQAFAEERGLEVAEEAWSRLDTLMGLWRRYGRAMNLTASLDPHALQEHVMDGLAVVRVVQRAQGRARLEGGWIDLGSGGGFPGLVVAATTDVPLVLIEPRERRAAFLELASNALGRGNLWTIRARVHGSTWTENVVAEVVERCKVKIAIATARAVMSPAQWLELGMNVVQGGGHVVVHHGLDDAHSIGTTPDAVEALGGRRIAAYRA